MRYLKMFIAGMTVPSIILPLLMLIVHGLGKSQILTIPFFHFIPWIWGIWNILYFVFFFKYLPQNTSLRLLITGAVLGLLVAAYGVFVLKIPSLVGLADCCNYLPLLIGPILYAILWRFLVGPLNHLLGIYEESSY